RLPGLVVSPRPRFDCGGRLRRRTPLRGLERSALSADALRMARSRPARAHLVTALLAILAACLLTLLPLSGEARAQQAAESPSAAGERVLAIVRASNRGPGTFHLTTANNMVFEVALTRPDGRAGGSLRLLRSATDAAHRFRTRSFAVEIGNIAPDPWIIEDEVRAAWAIAEHDDGSWATHVPG